MSYTKKFVASLATAGLLTGIVVPSAFAATNNSVGTVKSISDSATSTPLGKLTLREDDDFKTDMQPGTSFTYTLPSGIKFDLSEVTDVYKMVYWKGKSLKKGDDEGVNVVKSGDYTLTITLPSSLGGAENDPDSIAIVPIVKVDGFDGGDIEATIDPLDSGVTGGKYVIGRVATGKKTTASVIKVETIGDASGQKAGTFRIAENYAGAIGAVNGKSGDKGQALFTVKLPSNFKWEVGNDGTKVTGLAGYAKYGEFTTDVDSDGRTLTVYAPVGGMQETKGDRGIIEINPVITPDSDAKYGDVTVTIEGKSYTSNSASKDEINDADLVIATYVDFGTTVKVVGDVTTAVAGKYDNAVAKINIKENIAGSLTEKRKVRVDFPSWVKVTGIKDWNSKAGTWDKPTIDGKDSYVEINYKGNSGGTKSELEVQFYISVKGNAEGDIKATVSGRAGAEGEVLLGKAILPVSATVDTKELRVGVKEQTLNDIVISAEKGNLIDDKIKGSYREIKVKLTDGVTFNNTPTVEVVEGDADIDKDGVAKADGDASLVIPIKAAGTKAVKIKISNIKVDLDRSVPEGTIEAKIGGNAIVENDKAATSFFYNGAEYTEAPNNTVTFTTTTVDSGEFDQSWAVKLAVGKVITPADQNQKRTATFKIGESKMTIGGVETAMDAAPYIKNDRTYVPLRFVAKAVGVDDNNISFSAADQSVILIKGDRVVKLQLGSTDLTINGVTMTMDVAPEIVEPGRIMLPVKWVAQALGITATWDAATQTVTVN
ncbi:conserved hypothetical protein, possible surrface layer glycoprotein [Heliomicrobium modesticaldum Ice1]|uniref:Copper amine oxidase-like N-terminal domain-containing protein n=1 Tax=Heliobacterium modesticaldum (strain ATCC 51547 / Ice1) TaxID=498761 RepID=B0THK5_HELMI|nr:copper amine oxidase N-terminal domain-containing protein [Heliomicrobium modesticaldum]ABZ83443.1 conserved hypothetical protein, possible surrface layer glycoprotein [Heliomicrobium modesticaldum Ice1]